ncbi:unnamed protein product, partial [Polarella glacialis]
EPVVLVEPEPLPDFFAIWNEVPDDIVWKPLSFAEKNILKARKKLREVEKIEEAMAMKGPGAKIEQSQLAKVQKKDSLEQELRLLEQRSRSQGGRTLQELEKAEKWRKTYDENEKASTTLQKVFRGHSTRRSLPGPEERAKVIEENKLRRKHVAARRIQKVARKMLRVCRLAREIREAKEKKAREEAAAKAREEAAAEAKVKAEAEAKVKAEAEAKAAAEAAAKAAADKVVADAAVPAANWACSGMDMPDMLPDSRPASSGKGGGSLSRREILVQQVENYKGDRRYPAMLAALPSDAEDQCKQSRLCHASAMVGNLSRWGMAASSAVEGSACPARASEARGCRTHEFAAGVKPASIVSKPAALDAKLGACRQNRFGADPTGRRQVELAAGIKGPKETEHIMCPKTTGRHQLKFTTAAKFRCRQSAMIPQGNRWGSLVPKGPRCDVDSNEPLTKRRRLGKDKQGSAGGITDQVGAEAGGQQDVAARPCDIRAQSRLCSKLVSMQLSWCMLSAPGASDVFFARTLCIVLRRHPTSARHCADSRQGGRMSTKWGAFEVRSLKCMQACCLRQHSRSTVHRVAEKYFFAPEIPVSSALPYQLGGQDLLKGNVPQPADWLRAWQACQTSTSFAGAEKHYRTQAFIDGRPTHVKRKALTRMISAMQEAVRCCRRERLRAAQSLSVNMDDRKDYLLLEYSVDIPSSTSETDSLEQSDLASLPASSAEGVLGIRHLRGDLPYHDADKSANMTATVVEMIEEACADWNGKVDAGLLQHVTNIFRHYSSDQGSSAAKCGHLLPEKFPNHVWSSYDPAHQLRIASRDPLHAVPEFDAQWHRLFGGRHALVPDIKNSDLWRSKLIACEQYVLERREQHGGNVKAILKHLSFAKQRFDSIADPMMKYCVLIVSIAMLLAKQAADPRNDKHVRERAEETLQHMTPPELFSCGLTADYAMECVRFLRENFDSQRPDTAVTVRVTMAFVDRMQTLFVDGHILGLVPRQLSDGDGVTPRTISEVVLNQLDEAEPIYYGNRVLFLSTKAMPKEVRQIMENMAEVVLAMTKRVKVDLLGDQVGFSLQIFDLKTWETVRARPGSDDSGGDPASPSDDDAPTYRKLFDHCRFLCKVDNRAAWSWVLSSRWRAKYMPGIRTGTIEQLIRFYLSVRVAATRTERDLGTLTGVLQAHIGPLADDGSTVAAVLDVRCDGPQSEQDLFFRDPADGPKGPLRFTDFSRMCSQLFIERYGRRFCYTYGGKGHRESGQKRLPRSGTTASLKRSRAEAVDRLCEAAKQYPSRVKSATCVQGLTLTDPLSRSESFQGSRWALQPSDAAVTVSRAMRNFSRTTAIKDARHTAVSLRRSSGQAPYQPNPLRTGGFGNKAPDPKPIERPDGFPVQLFPVFELYSGIKGVFAGPGFSLLSTARHGFSCRTADLVVLEQLSDMETVDNADLACSLIYCYGMGKGAIARADLQKPSAERDSAVLRFGASALTKHLAVVVQSEFLEARKFLSDAITECANMKSKWEVLRKDQAAARKAKPQTIRGKSKPTWAFDSLSDMVIQQQDSGNRDGSFAMPEDEAEVGEEGAMISGRSKGT